MSTVIIATYAVGEAEYYLALSAHPAWPWRRTVFLSFSEIADQAVRRAGRPLLSVHGADRAIAEDIDVDAELERLGDPPEASRLRHEAVNNGIGTRGARRKFARRMLALERLLADAEPAPVIQELGGFASNLALLAWCRRSGRPHLSIEPGMFQGRLLFSRDSFFVDLSRVRASDADRAPAEAARRAFLDKPAFLVPLKDRGHFRAMGWKRVLSSRDVHRTVRKVYRLAVLRRREEFAAVSTQVREQFARYFRHRRMRGRTTLPGDGADFVYYPLHVPWDVQLTFRCPRHYDQIALLRRLADALPPRVAVVTKEHPAAVGSFDFRPLEDLLARGRLIVAPPTENSLGLSRRARAVVTVNSKVGFEALMAGRRVITLGRSFYRGHGLTVDVDEPEQAGAAALAATPPPPDEAGIAAFVARCWAATVPGELYALRPEHLAASAAGFTAAAATLLADARDLAPAPQGTHA